MASQSLSPAATVLSRKSAASMAIWFGLLAAAMPGGMPFLLMEDAMSSLSWTSFALPSNCASFWISWKLLLSDHHGKRRATLACSTERTENIGCICIW